VSTCFCTRENNRLILQTLGLGREEMRRGTQKDKISLRHRLHGLEGTGGRTRSGAKLTTGAHITVYVMGPAVNPRALSSRAAHSAEVGLTAGKVTLSVAPE
jgi:hypothetical protein